MPSRRQHRRPHHATQAALPRSVPVLAPAADADQPFAEGLQEALDPDLRHRLVSETAFHHLVERGYAEGYESDDWQQAECEVDHILIRPQTSDTA